MKASAPSPSELGGWQRLNSWLTVCGFVSCNGGSLLSLILAFDVQPRRLWRRFRWLHHPGVHNKNLVALSESDFEPSDSRVLIWADVPIFCAVRMPENGSAANVSRCDEHRLKQRVVRLAPSPHQRTGCIPPGSDGGHRWQQVWTFCRS
jgi:hypothetical protein